MKLEALHNFIGGLFGDSGLKYEKRKTQTSFFSITDFLPYRFYDEESEVFINEESIGFVLQIGNLFSANSKDMEVISNLLRDSIPEGGYLQILNYASPRIGDTLESYNESRKDRMEAIRFLTRKRTDFVSKGNWNDYSDSNGNYRIRNFKTFLIFSLKIKNSGEDFITKFANLNSNVSELTRLKIKELITIRKNFLSLLQSIGLSGVNLKAPDFISLLDEILNANYEDLMESRKEYKKFDFIANQIPDMQNRIEVAEDCLHLYSDNKERHLIAKPFSFKEYPTFFAQSSGINLIGDYFNDLAQIPCAFIQTLCVLFPFKAEETKAKIKLKSIKLQKNRENSLLRFFPQIAEESNEYNFISKKLDDGEKLVEIHMGVLLLSKPEHIEMAERSLRGIYTRNGFNLVVDKYLCLPSFLGFLPFTLGDGLFDDFKIAKRTERVLSWNVANLMPLQGELKGNPEPCMLLFGRRGQIYNFHPFKAPDSGNFNTCIVGKSGSGKSFFMQDYMMSIAGLGGKMIVIDDGQSFQKTCMYLGGKYIEFSEGNTICLNLFTLLKKEEELKVLKAQDDDEAPERVNFYDEVVNAISKMIRTIICRDVEKMCDEIETELINKAVKEAVRRYGYKGDIRRVSEILEEWYKRKDLDEPENVKNLYYTISLRMDSFTYGEFSKYFIGEANVEIDNRCVVFELSHIKDKPELQRVVTFFASFLGFKEMYLGSRGQLKSFVVDEAWALLSGKEMAEFMEGMARRARKYQGQLVIATQSAEDFYKSSATKAIIQNSDYLCILSQKPESITALEREGKLGDMSPQLKNTLLSIRTQKGKYSEVVIYAHGSYNIARLIVDPFSAKLYSSDAKDFKQISDLMRKGHSLIESLEMVSNG